MLTLTRISEHYACIKISRFELKFLQSFESVFYVFEMQALQLKLTEVTDVKDCFLEENCECEMISSMRRLEVH